MVATDELDMGKIPRFESAHAIGANIAVTPGHRTVEDYVERDADGSMPTLVQRAKAGDREAFGQIYVAHHARIFRLTRFYLGEGAEDAVAETFMQAYRSLGRYKSEANVPFIAWLYGIARNVVRTELKRRKKVECRTDLPDRSVDGGFDNVELRHAVAKLSKEHRRLVEMKYLLGMGNEEIAAALGKSTGAVNAQRWRALKDLRKVIES